MRNMVAMLLQSNNAAQRMLFEVADLQGEGGLVYTIVANHTEGRTTVVFRGTETWGDQWADIKFNLKQAPLSRYRLEFMRVSMIHVLPLACGH